MVGRFETKARLTVIPQEKPKKAPRFSELLSDKSETEGNTVVFEVRPTLFLLSSSACYANDVFECFASADALFGVTYGGKCAGKCPLTLGSS